MVFRVNGQNRLPGCFSLFHLAHAVVMSCDLQTGFQVPAVTPHGGLEIGKRVVEHVEVHVVKTALMPCRSCLLYTSDAADD